MKNFLRLSHIYKEDTYVNDRKLTSPFVGTFLYDTKSNFVKCPFIADFWGEKLVIGNEKGVGLTF